MTYSLFMFMGEVPDTVRGVFMQHSHHAAGHAQSTYGSPRVHVRDITLPLSQRCPIKEMHA